MLMYVAGVTFCIVISVAVNTDQRAVQYNGTESRICHTAWCKELIHSECIGILMPSVFDV